MSASWGLKNFSLPTGTTPAWRVAPKGRTPAPPPPSQEMEGPTARAVAGLGWGWGRWVPASGGRRRERERLDWAGTSGWGNPAPCGAGRERARRRWRRAGGGRGGRSGRRGRRARSGSGPSAGRRAGRAETRSGRGPAWAPSADSPDSCVNSRTRTVKSTLDLKLGLLICRMLCNKVYITLFSICCCPKLFSYLLISFLKHLNGGQASFCTISCVNVLQMSLNNQKCWLLLSVRAASSPLVSSVLKAPQPTRQVEGAVRSQAGVHPLGQVKDLRWREGLPLPLFSLQPALAPAG